ncbi:EI24 domain-containing protein [Pseudogemmobacter humi]|uniref:CysZ-like protein n=1 Tax=Pseudogemmobacter humi TaxID=2483812 RepID=A0A3P5XET4_9RHOB|nr:EI24 domain-containing protein [Pseudogemmobacter humi]VDC29387.1 CysZ-like protein [Pseudogemmobacter humi]
MILRAFRDTLGQLREPEFRRLGLIALALTLALLVAAYAAFLIFLASIGDGDVAFAGKGLADLLGLRSILVMLMMSFLLMVPVAAAFAALFLGDVAAAVEARDFAWLPPAGPPALPGGRLRHTVNFIGLLIVANALTGMALAFLGPMAIALWFLANGGLLGREYFTLAAARRFPPETVARLRDASVSRIWLAGLAMAVPLAVPVVNLAIPFLAAATFTRLMHRSAAEGL